MFEYIAQWNPDHLYFHLNLEVIRKSDALQALENRRNWAMQKEEYIFIIL